MRQIQASIIGYGEPRTLFSAYDPESDILSLAVETEYRPQRREGCIVISNAEIDRDIRFDAKQFGQAIAAYYELKNSMARNGQATRLLVLDRANRSNPAMAIERDGYDASGPKFRINEAINAWQVAALATCLYATKASEADRRIDIMETAIRMREEIFTL